MKYTVNQSYYKDGRLFELNKLSPRGYFIPFGSKEAAKAASAANERAASDLTLLLSGEWDFKLFNKVSEMPAVLDTAAVAFDKVQVPSVWQRTGHASPCYLNVRYPFPCKPPVIPEDIPVGVYRKSFTLEPTAVTLITFLGVTSCLTLYVNGKEVGYSEGAHNSAEFDISAYVEKGENELVAVLHKWSTGTYLECQDMFRDNGIFRDVYITKLQNEYIYDYCFATEYNADGTYDATASIVAKNAKGLDAEFVLVREGETVASFTAVCDGEGTRAKFKSLSVKEWSAEIPNTYQLQIALKKGGETLNVIKRTVGFRHIEVRGNVFYFNNKKIKLRGMNHHDTSPTKGFAISAEDIERDVKLMKSLNINCVRTSHYPPDAYFIECCATYGLYVVDEADIETHGCNPRINRISNDPAWRAHYIDRVSRLYFRDRSSPAITMWSLGNEAGGRKNQDACYEWLRERSNIPVHYEGVCRTRRWCYDVISEMYTHAEKMKKISEGSAKKRYYKKPFFLCEYCHTMGFAPGNIEDYWQAIYAADNMLGGCIWEWADHAVYHEDGKYRYTYGGDHGEEMHDGNFCCDGTVYPDRSLSISAYAVKNAYRPIRSQYLQNGVCRFENKLSFSDASHIKVLYELKNNRKTTESGEVALDLAAGECKDIKLGGLNKTDDDCLLNLTYVDESGAEVGNEQHIISSPSFEASKAKHVEIEGSLERWQAQGIDILNAITPSIVRAPIDNDRNYQWRWEREGYFNEWTLLDSVVEGRAVLRSYALKNKKGKTIAAARIRLDFLEDGVRVRTVFDPKSKFYRVPRLGVVLELPEKLTDISYYGYGPRPNLPDLLADSIIGEYRAKTESFDEPFIMPQTSGTHCSTRWAELFGEEGKGIRFSAIGSPFIFCCSRNTVKEIKDAMHREDIPASDKLYVNIDGFIMGSGNNSCGGHPTKEYQMKFDKPFGFAFKISERK